MTNPKGEDPEALISIQKSVTPEFISLPVDSTLVTYTIAVASTGETAALDAGHFSVTNIAVMEQRGIEPYIATGRDAQYKSRRTQFAELPNPPPEDAIPMVKMAYKLKTKIDQAIYKLRKATVEPVIGIIKEIIGFRQFSLRGLGAAAGEWCLARLAFNLKRLCVLLVGQL